MGVPKTVQSVLKTHGLSRTPRAVGRAALLGQQPLAAPVDGFQARSLEQVDREAAKLPGGATWLDGAAARQAEIRMFPHDLCTQRQHQTVKGVSGMAFEHAEDQSARTPHTKGLRCVTA